MRRDGRLSDALHALLHMAERREPLTSGQLAECMGANSAAIRRTMAGLRAAGIISSEKGRGGGWSIACDLDAVTLRDVYAALGEPDVFAIGNRCESTECLVEQAVNSALSGAFRDAEARLIDRLGGVSLAALSADFHRRMQHRKQRRSAGV